MQLRLLIATFAILSASAQPTDSATWKKLDFLVGKWTGVAGDKDTPNGAGQGDFSFDLELEKKIVVRHNNATYTSGARHDDVMIVYFDSNAPHAIYFDSEGHVIRYNVAFPKTDAVTFESDGTQPGPKYRLSYWMESGVLMGKFELAPPGSDYKPYLAWKSAKK